MAASMKLYYDKRLKDPTYYIQQGFRNGKKTTTKNIKRLGKHSELLLITDNPLEYAKNEVKKRMRNIVLADLNSLLLWTLMKESLLQILLVRILLV